MQGHWGNRGFCYTSAQAMHLHTGISEWKTSNFTVTVVSNALAMNRPLPLLPIWYLSVKCSNGFLFLANFLQILKCFLVFPISNGNEHWTNIHQNCSDVTNNLFGLFLRYFILLPSPSFPFLGQGFGIRIGYLDTSVITHVSLKS